MSVVRYHPAPCWCLPCRALDREPVGKALPVEPEPEDEAVVKTWGRRAKTPPIRTATAKTPRATAKRPPATSAKRPPAKAQTSPRKAPAGRKPAAKPDA